MELRRGDGSVIAVDVVGEQDASPVLLCHGLAGSRLSADWFGQAARDLGLCVIAPDRPGTGVMIALAAVGPGLGWRTPVTGRGRRG